MLIGGEDPSFAGGSYVVTQKYEQHQIMRFNMLFDRAGSRGFGTDFIGYARTPSVIEQMLQFIGKPPGNHDRILDFSTAVAGNLFVVPTVDSRDDPPSPGAASEAAATEEAFEDGSLAIGSLEGSSR